MGRSSIDTGGHTFLFRLLKAKLKEQKISYGELAKRLSLSEATLKRIFSHKDCSLERLAHICEAIGTTLFDLMQSATSSRDYYYSLPDEVETYFLTNIEGLFFYRSLTIKRSVAAAAQAIGLDRVQTLKFCAYFTKHGLLKISGDKVEIAAHGYFSINNQELKKKSSEFWAPMMLQNAIKADQKGYGVTIFSTGLSPQSFLELKNDINNLLNKYKDRGFFEQDFYNNVQDVGVVIGLAPKRIG
ncbi:MAG: helix-turn-helix domain-containing protein [Oligoflexales bacterium]